MEETALFIFCAGLAVSNDSEHGQLNLQMGLYYPFLDSRFFWMILTYNRFQWNLIQGPLYYKAYHQTTTEVRGELPEKMILENSSISLEVVFVC